MSSMKFWTMILGMVTAIGAKYGFKVDPETYWSIVGLFGLLIGAQGLTDHGKEAAKISANTNASVPVDIKDITKETSL